MVAVAYLFSVALIEWFLCMGEFDLIEQYFGRGNAGKAKNYPPHLGTGFSTPVLDGRVRLGIGDDAALLSQCPGHEWVLSTDMLISGIHFFPDTDPHRLGHKALAVNLSDLAAMGATPRYVLLALGLPRSDPVWIESFAQGFWKLAHLHQVELIGGDTTRCQNNAGLVICITVIGIVPEYQAICRRGAKVGDDIWVSGYLGLAAAGLAALRGEIILAPDAEADCVGHLEQPSPRIDIGSALRGIANAMIDISDGLAGDLAHIASASQVQAEIILSDLSMATPLKELPRPLALKYMLAGGDDYELCFTAHIDAREQVLEIQERYGVPLTRVGRICAPLTCAGSPKADIKGQSPVVYRDTEGGEVLASVWQGFDHFSN